MINEIGIHGMASDQLRTTDGCNLLQTLWEHLLNSLSEFAFFAQAADGTYAFASQSFLTLLGQESRSVIGRQDRQVFPELAAQELERAHRWVIDLGRSLADELTPLQFNCDPTRWYLLSKYPVFSASGHTVYVVGYLRALTLARDSERQLSSIAAALRHFRDNVSAPHTLNSLAEQAQVSTYQFERRVKRIFGISTRDYMIRARMQLGRDLLKKSDLDISAIAKECGYADQSSFTRQFRMTTGLPPGEFRKADREHCRTLHCQVANLTN